MDDLGNHKSAAREAMRSVGAQRLFPLVYSHDLCQAQDALLRATQKRRCRHNGLAALLSGFSSQCANYLVSAGFASA